MRLRVLYIFLCVINAFSFIIGQSDKERNKMLQKNLKEAAFYFNGGDYNSALNHYRKIIKTDNKNETANVNILDCHIHLNSSVDTLMFWLNRVQSYKFSESFFYAGVVYHLKKEFDIAEENLIRYKKTDKEKRKHSEDEIEYVLNMCDNAKKMMSFPNKSIIKNMGQVINSPHADYAPVISSDQSLIYFTSNRPKKQDSPAKDHDIYTSCKKDTVWQACINIGAPVNTDFNEISAAVNSSGDKLIFFRASVNYGGDLYISEKSNTSLHEWLKPRKFEKEINSQFVESGACFSKDTSEIYFSSSRPGGYGGKDIYRIKKLPNNKWSMPYNLGPFINTAYDEDTPYLHVDGVTLYFSSKGHSTMGAYDVFKSEYNADSNTYSKAQNLGYPINSVNNDMYFTINSSGTTGYYSSKKSDTDGSSDIYEIDMRYNENDVVVVTGTVIKGSEPGQAKITLINNATRYVDGIYNSNPVTGKFIFALNPFMSYKAIVEKNGYQTRIIEINPLADRKVLEELIIKIVKK